MLSYIPIAWKNLKKTFKNLINKVTNFPMYSQASEVNNYDIVYKNNIYWIIYFISIPIYVYAYTFSAEKIFPYFSNEILLPLIFVITVFCAASWFDVYIKKSLIKFVRKDYWYPKNTVSNCFSLDFVFTTKSKRKKIFRGIFKKIIPQNECSVDILKYYFYKNKDYKTLEELIKINNRVHEIHSKYIHIRNEVNFNNSESKNKYLDLLKVKEEELKELFPYGFDDYREYFVEKATKDYGMSYLNIFDWIIAIIYSTRYIFYKFQKS